VFLAQKRRKLALFGANDDTSGGPGLPSLPVAQIGFDWVRLSAETPFAGGKQRELGLFCTNDDTAVASAAL